MPTGKLYNLVWTYQRSMAVTAPYKLVSYSPGAAIIKAVPPPTQYINAIILYPSLLTPGIIAGLSPNCLELLILVKQGEPELKDTHVDNQLKICRGLTKEFDRKKLSELSAGMIVVTGPDDLPTSPSILETISGDTSSTATITGTFAGMIDQRALDHLHGKNYTKLYKVMINGISNCLTELDSHPYKSAGKTTKRNYYYDVQPGDWLEKIAYNHGIKKNDGSPLLANANTANDAAWHFIAGTTLSALNSIGPEYNKKFNKEFIENPVIFRQRDSDGNVITGPYVPTTPHKSRNQIIAEKKEVHIKDFDVTQRDQWKAGDSNVRSSDPWDSSFKRYIDKANRKMLYLGERIFIHDDEGRYEPQDYLMWEFLKSADGNGSDIYADGGLHCFAIKNGDIDMSSVRYDSPLQSYHPVLYYPSSDTTLNLYHITDLHLSSRQQVLKESPARVIEYTAGSAESDDTISPRLGSKINVSSKNVVTLFNTFGADGSDGMVLITGDVIDHIKNVNVAAAPRNSITKIWNSVRISSSSDANNLYQKSIDLIAFYSIIIDFYKRFKKPVYYVAGNHDCYEPEFGISPRALGGRRNAGICADHNLTLYEGILVFGKTFEDWQPNVLDFIKPNLYRWAFTMLTPFSEFLVNLPKLALMGLSWGDTEHRVAAFSGPNAQGTGHLGLADSAARSEQMSFVELINRISTAKCRILMTHFSFINYQDDISEGQPNGTINLAESFIGNLQDSVSIFEWGSFMRNKKKMFVEYIYGDPKRFDVIVTGHTHRRGYYQARKRTGFLSGSSFDTELRVFKNESPSNVPKPAFITSDSAGPMPRYNRDREFGGWGNDYASGTKISLSPYGNTIDKIEIKRALTWKPRFCVALDYWDLEGGAKVIDRFRANFTLGITPGVLSFELVMNLPSNISPPKGTGGRSVYVTDIILYHKISATSWRKMQLQQNGDRWEIRSSGDISHFRYEIVDKTDRIFFLAMKFNMFDDADDHYRHYNFDDYWTFEFSAVHNWLLANHYYEIIRDRSKGGRCDVPDFDGTGKRHVSKYGAKYA